MNYKKLFPIFNNVDMTYLDSAATSQKPKEVIDSICKYYLFNNCNIHRGNYKLSVETSMLYEKAKEKVSSFINSKSKDEIIFTKNATESLNLIARSYGEHTLKEGDEVVLSIMEHHSALVPWQELCKSKKCNLKYMYINDDYEISDSQIESKITKNTKIVSITHISNVTGTINNIEKIISYAHKMGAKVIVDASQSISHKKIDVTSLDIDFLVFSAHKMYAPLGVGVLYAKSEILENMPVFLKGGDMIEYVYEDNTTYAPVPYKFEAGTQNVEGVLGLMTAIDFIENITYDNIDKHYKQLTNYLIDELSKLEYVQLYVPKNRFNHSSVVSFNIKNIHSHDIASVLDSLNIYLRSGNHCAQPLLRYMNIDSTLRASIAIYNTKEDIDILIEGLKKAYKIFEKYINK